jgi:anti-anti-sigma factor
MKMVTAHVGSSALVRLTGRLDGEWSRHLSDTLDELLRDGLRSVVLDMSLVSYVSSPGLNVLGQRYRDFSTLRGELRISAASPAVLQALTVAGLLEHLLLLPGDTRVAGGPGRPSAAFVGPSGEFTGEAWQVPALVGPAGQYETSRRHHSGALGCLVVGRPDGFACGFGAADCRTIHFPSSVFGIGLGATGESFDDARPRFGELLAVGGAVAYLPTDAGFTPDWIAARGETMASAVLGAGLVCDGSFSNLIRFRPQPGSAGVPLTELAEVALATSGADAAGLVIAAEASELVTAIVRRSPAALDGPLGFDADDMREWLGFSPERAAGRRTALIAGVVARAPAEPLAGFLRRLGPHGNLAGHFHALIFEYRPVPQRTVSLRALVDKLLETQPLQTVGHVVFDDRGADGAGDNTLVRGLCWTGPIASVTAAP